MFKWVSFVVCKLYLNNAAFKKEKKPFIGFLPMLVSLSHSPFIVSWDHLPDKQLAHESFFFIVYFLGELKL